MRNIKLTIQYDGTNYSGWQSQKNSVAIQDIIERALQSLLGEKTKLIGASRTDAGVHAMGQTANFKTRSRLSVSSIKDGLNSILPPDIVIKKAQETSEDFHSQYDAKKKLYRYSLYAHNPVPPFYRNYVFKLRYKLDLDGIKEEAKALLGRHNFSSFRGGNAKNNNGTRCIHKIQIKKRGGFIYIDIEADGFLYNMARSIVGTLIDAGRGYLKKGSVKKILEAKDRRLAGSTAPAKGLCLMRVEY